MKIYTFAFDGEVKVKAKSEEDAYKIATDLVASTSYAHENSVEITVNDIELIGEREDIEALKRNVAFYKGLAETLKGLEETVKGLEESYPHEAKSEEE